MSPDMMQANAMKSLQALGMVGGSLVAYSGGAVSGAEWTSFVGGLTAVVSFGFTIYDTFVVDKKVTAALYTPVPTTTGATK